MTGFLAVNRSQSNANSTPGVWWMEVLRHFSDFATLRNKQLHGIDEAMFFNSTRLD